MEERTQESNLEDVEVLNKMLQGEISAVETYTRCIESSTTKQRKQAFGDLRDSHAKRRDQIANRIRMMGGTPATSSGGWGRFASFVQGTASKFGEDAVLKTLREGEYLGLRMYERTDEVSQHTQRFLESNILPEQRETQRTINEVLRESA